MLNPDAEGYDDAPWLWSDQYQHNIQILGIPQPGSRTIVREDALYFSLDENGRLTQLVAFNDARTVKLAKRWMAAGIYQTCRSPTRLFTDVIAIANPHP